MKKDNDEIHLRSSFNNILIIVVLLFLVFLLYAALSLLNNGYEKWEDTFSKKIAFICLLLAFGTTFMLFRWYKKILFYKDRLEIYNCFNQLRTKIYFKDILAVNSLLSTTGGDVWGSGNVRQILIVVTADKEHSFDSMTFTNLKAMKAYLQTSVNCDAYIPKPPSGVAIAIWLVLLLMSLAVMVHQMFSLFSSPNFAHPYVFIAAAVMTIFTFSMFAELVVERYGSNRNRNN